MKTTNASKKKFLLGLSVSLVLAMAIGNFALSETNTPANTQAETQSAAVNDGTGAFNVDGGTVGTDYDYLSGVLSIHPQSSATQITISTNGETTDCIEITAGPQDAEKAVNIILNGVNINRSNEAEATPKAALKIAENAGFNTNITLAENSVNTLIGEAGALKPHIVTGSPGIEKSNDGSVGIDQLGKLTIGGTGKLTAEGGVFVAGIGGGFDNTADTGYNGSNITITGGNITATGGQFGAGIGGGYYGNGTDITITGGKVEAYAGDYDSSFSDSALGSGIGGGAGGNGTDITISGGEVIATGKNGGAGIGGGGYGNGSNITISGGVVTATGGYLERGGQKRSGAGIGSGAMGTASGNKLNGNAVVLAISGEDGSATGGVKPQLDGFVDDQGDSLITQGIAFTGVGQYELICPDPSKPTDGNWVLKSTTWNEGEQYGNVTITEDITFPAGLKIDSTVALTIGKNAEGKEATLSMAEGKKLTVEGSLINEGVIDIPAENFICNGNGKITTLLNYDPQGGSIKTNDDNYITYQDASGTKKYENLPEATKEGYDLEGWYTKEKGQGTKIETTDDVLLNQHILYANWVESEPPTPTPPTPTPPGPEPQPTPPGPEPGPEPEPTPTPEPTPDPSVNPDGDGSGSGTSSKTSDPFMGGIALALLGVATTGVILTRKRN